MKNLPDFLPETQFLQDIRNVAGRISEVVEADSNAMGGHREGVVVKLLRLALSLESAIALWCLRNVQIERGNPHSVAYRTLARRLESAIEDANRIAERLHQLTGTIELQLDWLPSANMPVVSGGWSFRNALLEGMAAETITLECYQRLILHIRPHDSPTASILEQVASARLDRLKSRLDENLMS
jgi:hypothetical protein